MLWLVLVVLAFAAAGTIYGFTRDRRVHPFEGTPSRPIDDHMPYEEGK